MGKKLSSFLCILIAIIFAVCINIFLKLTSDTTHLFGINILLIFNLFIYIIDAIAIAIIFKRTDFSKNGKDFRLNLKMTIANSFCISSFISIICAIIIYCFSGKILSLFSLSSGIINYSTFALKTWFIASPFIGLELTIFYYYSIIACNQKPVFILLVKFLAYVILALCFHLISKTNCIVYAKPICDILFLIYYIKICFNIEFK
jgi:hypothetical protein